MKILNAFFNPQQHCEITVYNLCQALSVKVTLTTLQKDLVEHPDYPSLLSISDVIKNYGIDNFGFKLGIKDFKELPTPFIAHIHGRKVHHDVFAVVGKVNENSIGIYNPESKKQEVWTNNDFSKMYTGNVLVVEPNENAGEQEYKKAKAVETQRSIHNYIALFLLPVIVLGICIIELIIHHTAALMPVVFTLLTLAGCIVGVLLIWYETDQHNPVMQQICHSGKKVNCNAILNSKAARLWGISWSSWGSVYFLGMLLSLIAGGLTNANNLFLLGWINVLALPYVFFSISYQWLVAKQWCILCLTVQAILLLQFITVYVGRFNGFQNFQDDSLKSYLTVIGCFSFSFVAILVAIPALGKAKENRGVTVALQRLKHNPRIFEALLTKQKTILHPVEGLGITIGNPDAKNKLIKVCNPYCGPCAKAHSSMEELLKNNDDLQIQILFTATGDDADIKTPPAKHLLAIAAKENEEITKQALDDWYLAEKKDYSVFAAKYQLHNDLHLQNEKIAAMKNWCDKTEISFTPTFFVNGYQLPDIYSITDLKYFLTT